MTDAAVRPRPSSTAEAAATGTGPPGPLATPPRNGAVTPASRVRPLLAVAVILLLSIGLTAGFYGPVVAEDVGLLWVYDDADLIGDVADGYTVRDFFFQCGDHLCGVTRAVYYALYTLAGRWWPPYGLVLLAAHAAACGLVGIVIWRIGSSLATGLAVTAALVPSIPLSTGPLTNFVHFVIYVILSALLLLIPITQRYAERGSPVELLKIGAIGLPTLFVTTASIFLFPLVCLYYAAFKIAADRWSLLSPRFPYLRLRRAEALLAATLILLFLTYIAAVTVGIRLYSNPPPGQGPLQTSDWRGLLPVVLPRFADIVTYGLIGLLPLPTGSLDTPRFVPAFRDDAAVFTVLAGGFLLWQLLAARGSSAHAVRRMAACGLASVAMVLVYALLATLGRSASILTLGHMRYNAYAVVFWCVALGMIAAIIVARTPRRLAAVPLALLLAGGIYLSYANATTVQESRFYASRGIWWCDPRFDTVQEPGFPALVADKREEHCRQVGAPPVPLEEGPREKPVASYQSSPPTAWTILETQTYQITVTNQGVEIWHASATRTNRPFLGVHFGTDSDRTGGWETNQRFFLPHDVAPGESVTIEVEVTAPANTGTYVLRHRMARQGQSWSDQIQKTPVTVSSQ